MNKDNTCSFCSLKDLKLAEESLDSGNISSALKYYYACLIMLRSIPEDFIKYDGKDLFDLTRSDIDKVLAGLDFYYIRTDKLQEDYCEARFKVEYENEAVLSKGSSCSQ